MDRRALAERLDLRGGERKVLTRVLKQMVRDGVLEEQGGRYHAAAATTVTGTFSRTDQGYGFVVVIGRAEDVFIPAQHVGSAMNGDQVRVRLRRSLRDRRQYGEIAAILTRAHSRVIGTLQLDSAGALVIPHDSRQGPLVRVALVAGVAVGDVVEVAIERYPEGGAPARGRISERLGSATDPHVDVVSVIRTKNIPDSFSAQTMEVIATVATEVSAEDFTGRTDLRNLLLVTIDGETARDFDDAVALQKAEDGSFRLWVCIADVAHYVAVQGPIDQDARERGTSVYFPGFVVPMLPEALSNGICSLNPGVDRLVMTAELQISAQGETLAAQFYPAVMNSHARLTYTQVAACLAGADAAVVSQPVRSQLQQMAELAEILTRMRYERGSLNLDLAEVEIRVDETGRPLELVKIERTMAHRLVEEFMLAANEAVAGFLDRQGWPFLYRVHEEPEQGRLEELQQLAASCGHGLVLGADLHRGLQKLLEAVVDKPEARLISEQLLRSLQQAVYTPHNEGHFGLAAEDYCHFTSPIRRYPDLVVHRILKSALAGQSKKAAPGIEQLELLGTECSFKERRAMEAERDLLDLRRCQLMQDRIGEVFAGIISSVVEFGFFVELEVELVEGLVHIRALKDDFYHFDPAALTLTGERERRQFRIGVPVTVKLDRVDLRRRRIDFVLAEPAAMIGSAPRQRQATRAGKKIR